MKAANIILKGVYSVNYKITEKPVVTENATNAS